MQQDYAVAAAYYRKGLEKGNIRCAVALGVLHELGQGVEQSYSKAAEFYEEPARLGDREAQANLANLYANGNGVTKDLARAIELLEAAAAQDSASTKSISVGVTNAEKA